MQFLNAVSDWFQVFENRAIFLAVLAIALAAGGVVEAFVGRGVPRWKKNVAILAMCLVLWIVLGSLVGLLNR